MSLECSECERDLRGGHDPSCSRHPRHKHTMECAYLKWYETGGDEDDDPAPECDCKRGRSPWSRRRMPELINRGNGAAVRHLAGVTYPADEGNPPVPLAVINRAVITEIEEGELVYTDYKHRMKLVEPLRGVDHVPADAHPHCCYQCTVIFYNRDTMQELARTETHSIGFPPHLIKLDGRYWEVSGAMVKQYRGRWCAVWDLSDNTRLCEEFNRDRGQA